MKTSLFFSTIASLMLLFGVGCSGLDDPTFSCKTAPTNQACIEIYAPVCGCDGETYSNSCHAEAAGVKSFSAGSCL